MSITSALVHHWSIPRFPTVQRLFRYPESQRENKRTPKIRLNKAHWTHIRSIYSLIDFYKIIICVLKKDATSPEIEFGFEPSLLSSGRNKSEFISVWCDPSLIIKVTKQVVKWISDPLGMQTGIVLTSRKVQSSLRVESSAQISSKP